VQAVGKRLGTALLDPVVSAFRFTPPPLRLEECSLGVHQLRARGIDGGARKVRHHRVHGDEAIRMIEGDEARDDGADVVGVRPESRIAELLHQLDPEARDAGARHASSARPVGVAEPGDRGDDHVEAVRLMPSVSRRVAEARDELDHLDERAGPPVDEEQRHGRGPLPALDDDVDVQALDLYPELRELVEPPFLRSPVEVGRPVRDQVLHVSKVAP
jgi:hypothetical protein